MIGAIEGSASCLHSAARAGVAPPSVSAPPAVHGGAPELAQQVTELIETYGETAEAILQAQVSIFKESLDIGQSMAAGVLQMLRGVQAFQAQVQPDGAAGNRIDVVA